MRKFVFQFFLFFVLYGNAFSQEILLSPNELYYDFLALSGYIERPYLNYRTLSDSVWDYSGSSNRIWQETGIENKRSINEDIAYRIYGPALFTSYNSTYPYGQNDAALWQGKGFNSSISGGARLELYGFELTFLPQVAFSQNKSFRLVSPDPAYSGEAAKYGYYGVPFIDAPQRFGDDAYHEFSWGDSEIRYSWKTFTVGFGTQNIWLGPAKINPILLSNNAPPYPKFDIGLRKQPITMFDVYLGDIETRAFWGRLTESDFFDNDDSNNHNLLTGFSFAYSPSFAEGFTLGLNRVMLSKWRDHDFSGILTLFWPKMENTSGDDARDQRSEIIFNYCFPSVGFETYFEWALNDFNPGPSNIIRYPFHTQAYTFGARKDFLFNKIRGEVLLEITSLESSRDYEFLDWNTTFYAHGDIIHGHTNRGQWLGAGMGTGGNSQYLGIKIFYSKGYLDLFIQRQNIDNDYVWFMNKGSAVSVKHDDKFKFKTLLSIGINNYIFIYDHIAFYSSIVFSDIYNPTYDHDSYPKSKNIFMAFSLKFIY
jgi:hypothetical protein